ncbi:hypothetical protein DVH24_008182 [Malus domestica]|uniref:Uncharacterized protein n=1 Tax=Malus domestica TaxID=3750 RepID=A0A498JQ20_MALDO|nr:hypothetical protein DVH24_008182 [Malus domestica]
MKSKTGGTCCSTGRILSEFSFRLTLMKRLVPHPIFASSPFRFVLSRPVPFRLVCIPNNT